MGLRNSVGTGDHLQHARQNSSTRSSSLFGFLKNAALFIGSILILCLITEGILRFVYHPENIGTVIQFDPQLGWSLKPGAYLRSVDNKRGFDYRIRVNSRGMREREFSPIKKSAAKRILLVGDSITFGTGVEAERRFSNFMNRALGEDIEVLNGGVCGWGTDQELIYYESFVRDLNPDIVILSMTMANDVINNMLDHLFLESAPKPKFVLEGDSLKLANPMLSAPIIPFSRRIRNFLKHHSRLLVFVKRRIDKLKYNIAMKDDPECMPSGFERAGLDRAYSHWSVYEKSYGTCLNDAWRVTEALLEQFAALCRRDDAELIIFAFPLKIEIDKMWRRDLMNHYDIDPARFDFRKPYRRLSEFCRLHDIELLYPVDEFNAAAKMRHLYFENDSHPNQFGHAAAAQAILEKLRERFDMPFTVAGTDLAYFPSGN